MLALVYFIIVSIFQTIWNDRAGGGTFFEIISKSPAPACIILYCIIIMLSISTLFFYHCYLLHEGQTTYESIKSSQIRPWDEGFSKNCYNSLCRPIEPSLLDTINENSQLLSEEKSMRINEV